MLANARKGDTSSHGGEIITASSDVFNNGKEVALDGDILNCAAHGNKPIKAITTSTFINDKLVLTIGAVAECGAIITTGSPDTFSE